MTKPRGGPAYRKIDDQIVKRIRMRAAEGVTRKDLAKMFRVSTSRISLILTNKIWTNEGRNHEENNEDKNQEDCEENQDSQSN